MVAFFVFIKNSLLFVSKRYSCSWWLLIILCVAHNDKIIAFEFPQVNYEHYNGRKYQFMYGLGMTTSVDPADVSSIMIISNIAIAFMTFLIADWEDIEGWCNEWYYQVLEWDWLFSFRACVCPASRRTDWGWWLVLKLGIHRISLKWASELARLLWN